MMKKHLSILGIGPIYVTLIAVITLLAYLATRLAWIPTIHLLEKPLPLYIIAICTIIFGIYLWAQAVFNADITQNIKENELVTSGVYALVRNPIYSAFMLVADSLILAINNLYLLPLILIYWWLLTLMLQHTEEVWLEKLYGQPYRDYCKRVNRCFPWFAKK